MLVFVALSTIGSCNNRLYRPTTNWVRQTQDSIKLALKWCHMLARKQSAEKVDLLAPQGGGGIVWPIWLPWLRIWLQLMLLLLKIILAASQYFTVCNNNRIKWYHHHQHNTTASSLALLQLSASRGYSSAHCSREGHWGRACSVT